jgi:hypothetical protein
MNENANFRISRFLFLSFTIFWAADAQADPSLLPATLWQWLLFPLYIFDGKGFLLLVPGVLAGLWGWASWRKTHRVSAWPKWSMAILGAPWWLMIIWMVFAIIYWVLN